MSKNKKFATIILLFIAVIIILIPLISLKGAQFNGSDDAGSVAIAEISGEDYEPWFTPVLEKIIGSEVPGSVESLFFCIQTGIGVAIIFFFLGRFVERNKKEKTKENNHADKNDGN